MASVVALVLTGSCAAYTVSGQSSGGSMAIQHLFAFSDEVRGAAIVAGSPYGCVDQPSYKRACYFGGSMLNSSLQHIADRVADELIANPANLRNTPVLLFGGKDDNIVWAKAMDDVRTQLEVFIDEQKIKSVFNTSAGHVWSLDYGPCACGSCVYYYSSYYDSSSSGSSSTGFSNGLSTDHSTSDFFSDDIPDDHSTYYYANLCCDVNNCGYDLTRDMLQHFFGYVNPKKKAKDVDVKGWLHVVDQRRYLPAYLPIYRHARMLKFAFVYVPNSCRANPEKCRIHVHYHGCMINGKARRKAWSSELGLNRYAATNNMIVLYPQAAGDARIGDGCWNWGGDGGDRFDDPQYDTRESLQLRTVVNMIRDVPNALARPSLWHVAYYYAPELETIHV